MMTKRNILGASFIARVLSRLAKNTMKTACLIIAAGTLALNAQVIDKTDWKVFLSQHDMVWKKIPGSFNNAGFIGNGHLGSMVYFSKQGESLLCQMGRSDVTFKTSRIPIGDLVLVPSGKILTFEMRLDLWNAELFGKITTDKGEIEFRTFTHSVQMVNVFETIVKGEEKATWSFNAAPAVDTRAAFFKKEFKLEDFKEEDRNDPPVFSQEGDISICFQSIKPEGGHSTAWKIVSAENKTTVYSSIGFAKNNEAAKSEAVTAIKKALSTDFETLVKSHRDWWNQFWPQGFVSIPDTRLEGFYYIQMYKMASATRPGRPAIDLMGPWFRRTPWAKIWWNLNIQLTYWPQLTGNRLELGESLCEMIDSGADALANNAGIYKDDSAAIGRSSGYDCVRQVEAELCNLPWAMHNYWLQYRYSMDEEKLLRLFPILKRTINYYHHLLKEGPDGMLHLTNGHSPEYPGQPKVNPDVNIDLALLRWGCETLLNISAKLKNNDPLIPRWKNTLAKLTPYPQDENGLKISAKVPFAESHRHYSHLLMIYPLYIMNLEQPENRELVIKSLKHWMGMPNALQGYSFTGAASISAVLGEGDEAARYLKKLLDSKIQPNTMYLETGPVIETPLSAAASLNDMLLSSWGDRIRVFPGIPTSWKDTSFHNLRTEGAFLVSATRKDGKTQWVRIKSLAGEPCRIRPNLAGEVKATCPIKKVEPGVFDLTIGKGEEAFLYLGDTVPALTIAPVAGDPSKYNLYGENKK